ncbi:hypothetical protein [uncultured Nitrosomonas sp.]|uniref:hypothetical protein n=1 Tax=uncultured Nitrosomonas sp. TaxID=156424 RepID=UPI00260C123C|nr:hypothetical protein [uncultured Nitrosomonas sp.]
MRLITGEKAAPGVVSILHQNGINHSGELRGFWHLSLCNADKTSIIPVPDYETGSFNKLVSIAYLKGNEEVQKSMRNTD